MADGGVHNSSMKYDVRYPIGHGHAIQPARPNDPPKRRDEPNRVGSCNPIGFVNPRQAPYVFELNFDW